MEVDLSGRVALVAGATRGAGRALAVELARSGAFVYATGRSSRESGPSDMGRPETIEETGDLISSVGGQCSAMAWITSTSTPYAASWSGSAPAGPARCSRE